MECKNCNIKFEPLRLNQIFCSKKCRTKYHNNKAFAFRLITKQYNKGLVANRRILENTLKKFGNRLVSKEFLLGAGYNFSLLTHSLEDEANVVHNFCYDFALSEIKPQLFQIIQYQHNV